MTRNASHVYVRVISVSLFGCCHRAEYSGHLKLFVSVAFRLQSHSESCSFLSPQVSFFVQFSRLFFDLKLNFFQVESFFFIAVSIFNRHREYRFCFCCKPSSITSIINVLLKIFVSKVFSDLIVDNYS